ncbi:sulfatase-like hydrolase/transferase [Chloroflexi bacterium TSY]|nr:sulfatase-like hydrolase/transferase [Chloroflexi bacterium TSY]
MTPKSLQSRLKIAKNAKFGSTETGKEIANAWTDLQKMYICANAHGQYHPGEAAVKQVMEAYWQSVAFVDEQLGRLFDYLEQRDLLDSTAVMVTADHGEEFFEHGRWGHYQLYDENIRVPLLLWIPGRNQGQTIENQVSAIDLAPTICELMGVLPDEGMLGRSVLPLLHGEQDSHSDIAYVESMWSNNYRLVIRTETYKYMYEEKISDRPELYNLQDDPAEKRNLWNIDLEQAHYFDELRIQHQQRAEQTNQASMEMEVDVDKQLQLRLEALGYMD